MNSLGRSSTGIIFQVFFTNTLQRDNEFEVLSQRVDDKIDDCPKSTMDIFGAKLRTALVNVKEAVFYLNGGPKSYVSAASLKRGGSKNKIQQEDLAPQNNVNTAQRRVNFPQESADTSSLWTTHA